MKISKISALLGGLTLLVGNAQVLAASDDSGPFDASCYLARYPDVARDPYYGRLPYDHYVNHGQKEGRKGGCHVSNSQIKIGIQPTRFAGSVTNVVWNNKEFINIHDHGRQLQSALQVDGFSECNNPTEAGSEFDGEGATSSSVMQSLSYDNGNKKMSVETQMAYWYYQKNSSTKPTGACPIGFDARANNPLSSQKLSKEIILDAFGDSQIVQFNMKYKMSPGSYNKVLIFEYLTGYLNTEFNTFWYYKPSQNKLIKYTDEDLFSLVGNGFPNGSFFGKAAGKETNDPVVFSTADQKYAMGVVNAPKDFTSCGGYFRGYDVYKFNLGGSGPGGNGTTKWALSTSDEPNSACLVNHTRSFTVYLVIGELSQVQAKVKMVYDSLYNVQPEEKIPAGIFRVGGGIYYSNSTSYCGFPSMPVYTQLTGKTDVNGVTNYSSLPTKMNDVGICTSAFVKTTTPPIEKLPAGIFKVGGGIYYSNGTSYCGFPSMPVYTQLTGKMDANGVRNDSSLPQGMNNVGLCSSEYVGQALAKAAIPAGLFKVAGGIYYSNGSAFCKTRETNGNGVAEYVAIPQVMRNDGNCQ